MQKHFFNIIIAVISGNATPYEILLAEKLIKNDATFKKLYQDCKSKLPELSQNASNLPKFNAEIAFKKFKSEIINKEN